MCVVGLHEAPSSSLCMFYREMYYACVVLALISCIMYYFSVRRDKVHTNRRCVALPPTAIGHCLQSRTVTCLSVAIAVL